MNIELNQLMNKKKLRVDGKPAYQLPDPSDSFINALQMANPDSSSKIRILLTIGYVSPIGSTEAVYAASRIGQLKTPYQSTMSDSREPDLNLIQLEKVIELDVSNVAQIFVNLNRQRLFISNSPLYDTNNDPSICAPSQADTFILTFYINVGIW